MVKKSPVPLTGFAGGPFTLASYLVEGGPSRSYTTTETLMWGEPRPWRDLVDHLAAIALASLRAQVEAGAAAVRIFESWGGAVSPADCGSYVLPALKVGVGAAPAARRPSHRVRGVRGELLQLFSDAAADVVTGVDWRVPLDVARRRVGPDVAPQGNLGPTACFAPWEVLARQAGAVLGAAGPTGHIFNLGHGVLPATAPAQLARLVDVVHSRTGSSGAGQ